MKEVQTIMEQLEARGERLTIQRRLVIDALIACDKHLTILDIQRWVEHQSSSAAKLSEATIYRILEWLKTLGMVSQTDLGAMGITYTLLGHPLHHHLICLNCGGVFELDDAYFAELRHRLYTDFKFLARIDHMAIYGHCRQCAPDPEDPTASHHP